ncbi:hypothetical protein [Vibrio marisflavi]|nr:hypothetical protein [Vibrio marisflavi]
MNNIENNFLHKAFCYLILYTTAAISMYLTVSFMYSLGGSAGMAVAFAFIGVVFDTVKSYTPTLITKIVRKGQGTALLLGVISFALIALSTAASVFSLQNGIESALSETKAAKVTQLKIQSLRDEIAGLETLRAKQLSVTQVTPAAKTTEEITSKREQLSKELGKSASVTSDSLLSSFSTPIILIIAISLEVISIAMTLCLAQLSKSSMAQRYAAVQGAAPVRMESSETRDETEIREETKTVKTSVSSTVSSVVTRKDIIDYMCVALRNGDCSPSHRSIFHEFRTYVKQKEVKGYLEELASMQVIRPTSNGSYEVVETS